MKKPRIIIGVLSQILLTVVIFPILTVSTSSNGGDHFKRRDPLNGLSYYNNGFDVRNKHYWAATAFTGFPGYVIAGIWIIAGVCLGLYVAFFGKRRRRVDSTRRRGYLDGYYLHVFLLLLFFMLFSMAMTGIVIASNQSSKNKTKEIKETIDKAGEDVQRNIRTVIVSLTKIQYLLLPYDQKTTHLLNVTTHRLGKDSRTIHRFVHRNGRSIDRAIKILYVSHLVIASTNLFVLLLAFVPLLLHWYPGFIMVIFLCWILTTLCWVLTGFDFFLHTFAEDLCSAFNGFIQNPQNNTLTTLFPCMDPLHSDKTLIEISSMIHNFITKLNSKVSESMRSSYALTDQSTTVSPAPESGLICDPFGGQPIYSYTPQSCSNGAIPIGDFPNILSKFTCRDKVPPETCRVTGKFIPEAAYLKVYAYSNSAQGMLDILPSLQNLTQCLAVKDTLSSIVLNQCKPFRVSMFRLWASMLVLSILMKVMVLLFLAKAFQEKGKSFVWFSIYPISSQGRTQVNI